MPLPQQIRDFLRKEVRERFLRYVQVYTTSDESSQTKPSTARQFDLLRILEAECRALGLADVQLSQEGFVYATLPASAGPGSSGPATPPPSAAPVRSILPSIGFSSRASSARAASAGTPFGLLAHVDTSPEQPGEGVKPVLHEKWDGKPIRFADDPELTLSIDDSSELAHFIGDTIITASGKTLLGADDKAGVSEIMSALATLRAFPELPHPAIHACFTTDEEIGRGTKGLDLKKLPQYCYTMDGSMPGELEAECFDAWRAAITFKGVGVHPGFAKGKLVNASHLLARFLAELPVAETPERTDGREGFFYLYALQGSCERATATMILRDFEESNNRARMQRLETLKQSTLERFPGLAIEIEFTHQYQNMRDVLVKHPRVVEHARLAIADTGLDPLDKSIRGGTDGSLLCQLGHPTPNIFAGGMLFHSRREWVAERSLAQATETIIHLARRWAT